jgi:hypothetical protein
VSFKKKRPTHNITNPDYFLSKVETVVVVPPSSSTLPSLRFWAQWAP